MRGMNSACIDLIYLDPPFNSNADYAAPIGSEAAGAEFKDTWSLDDVKTEWVNLIKMKHPQLHRVLLAAPNDSMKSYLIYMAIRILEMKRILKLTGTIYLHCDPTASHYLKVLMDSVFGQSNFRNEIVWCYSNSGRSKKKFTAKHDIILCYGNGGETTWTGYRVEARQEYIDQMYRQRDPEGRQCRIRVDAGKQRIYYPEDGVTCNDWWADIPSLGSIARERVGYPTQKPLALLKRIIDASSNPGDMVLDPFCGCATALVAADRRQRNWVGIDVGEKAAELVETRIRKDQGEQEYQNNLPAVFNEPIRRTDRPMRDDLGRSSQTSNPQEHSLRRRRRILPRMRRTLREAPHGGRPHHLQE